MATTRKHQPGRTYMLRVKMSVGEKRQAESIAEALGLNVSSLVRMLIRHWGHWSNNAKKDGVVAERGTLPVGSGMRDALVNDITRRPKRASKRGKR